MKQRYLLPFWCMRNSFKEVALATKAKTPARTQGFFQLLGGAICRCIFVPAQPNFLATSVREFVSGDYTRII